MRVLDSLPAVQEGLAPALSPGVAPSHIYTVLPFRGLRQSQPAGLPPGLTPVHTCPALHVPPGHTDHPRTRGSGEALACRTQLGRGLAVCVWGWGKVGSSPFPWTHRASIGVAHAGPGVRAPTMPSGSGSCASLPCKPPKSQLRPQPRGSSGTPVVSPWPAEAASSSSHVKANRKHSPADVLPGLSPQPRLRGHQAGLFLLCFS